MNRLGQTFTKPHELLSKIRSSVSTKNDWSVRDTTCACGQKWGTRCTGFLNMGQDSQFLASKFSILHSMMNAKVSQHRFGLAMTCRAHKDDLNMNEYIGANRKYQFWHPVNVANGLKIGWLKCDKWHLSKNMGPLGWFVCSSKSSCSYSVAKEKGLLGICLDNCWNNLRLFPENCMWFIFFTCKNVSFLYFDQGRRSCPRASCCHYNGNINYGTMSAGTPVTFNML